MKIIFPLSVCPGYRQIIRLGPSLAGSMLTPVEHFTGRLLLNPVLFYLAWANPVLTIAHLWWRRGNWIVSPSPPPAVSLCIVAVSRLSLPYLCFVPASHRKASSNKTPVLCLHSLFIYSEHTVFTCINVRLHLQHSFILIMRWNIGVKCSG